MGYDIFKFDLFWLDIITDFPTMRRLNSYRFILVSLLFFFSPKFPRHRIISKGSSKHTARVFCVG
jgi:hypothetical protein